MSIETVPGTALRYYLIAFDADGRERIDDPEGLMSQRALAVLEQEPITDVFIISHGWKGDVPAAREQYNNWIGAMARCEADLAQVRQARPQFQPLLIGLHWPSLPWGEEELGAASVSFDPVAVTPVAQLIDQYAERLANTEVGRFYPLGAGVRRQVTFAPGELPKYGGLGTFGVRGLDEIVVDLDMLPVSTAYAFAPGKIYNLESSLFICEDSGASGAHSDIAKPEVAHAVWSAVWG